MSTIATTAQREANRRYLLRIGLRALVIFSITLFIAQQNVAFATAISLVLLCTPPRSFYAPGANELATF